MLSRFLRRISSNQEVLAAGFLGVAAIVGAASWYGYTRIVSLSEQVTELTAGLASTTALLQDATTSLSDAFAHERQIVESQVGAINGTVMDLQKLSAIDSELLAKYSKVFFLSDNYAPARLAELPSEYKYSEKKPLQVLPEVLPYLQKMLDQAKADGVPFYVDSAYRSFNTQEALKERYVMTYGAGTANQFSAEQGYSEHQLGTAVDLITTGTGGQLIGFERTPAYAWLTANAYRYGFVLSYPKNNSYYMFEPWHWRFVGVKLATNLHATNSYFYTMDQRTIDAYLISLFD